MKRYSFRTAVPAPVWEAIEAWGRKQPYFILSNVDLLNRFLIESLVVWEKQGRAYLAQETPKPFPEAGSL